MKEELVEEILRKLAAIIGTDSFLIHGDGALAHFLFQHDQSGLQSFFVKRFSPEKLLCLAGAIGHGSQSAEDDRGFVSFHAAAGAQPEAESRVDDRVRHLKPARDTIGLHEFALARVRHMERLNDGIVRQRIHRGHLHQRKRFSAAGICLRTDDDRCAQRCEDREQVGGKWSAALGMVAGHENIARHAARAAHLIAGNQDGVPLESLQAGRLF